MTHAELLFAKTANRITKLVGTRGLTCGQIERLASRLFGRKWPPDWVLPARPRAAQKEGL
jgi:hypothetical protein